MAQDRCLKFTQPTVLAPLIDVWFFISLGKSTVFRSALRVIQVARLILYIVNDCRFFITHRLSIALEAKRQGFDIAVVCPIDSHSGQLTELAIRHISVPMGRGACGVLREIMAAASLFRTMYRERPDLVHLITSKPIILGGLAARLLGIPCIAAVSGLGHVFVDESAKSRFLRKIVLLGYWAALKRKGAFTIFQNGCNRDIFVRANITNGHEILIPGSGADLSRFDPAPRANSVPVVVLPCRMLWTKGVGEFVEAARLLQSEDIRAEFLLVGDPDPRNPSSVDAETLQRWSESGFVRWLGYRSDIEGILQNADIVVLPSYYPEGLPKTLIDAAAAGRATITTDSPGCREAIKPGETGLLVRARDPADLAEKIRMLIEDDALRIRMGQAGRRLAESQFDVRAVAQLHLALYKQALAA